MPLFEYVCKKCNHPFEALVRGDEAPRCPECGSRSLIKQLSVPAAHSGTGTKQGGFNTPCGMPPGSCGRECGLS